VKWREQQKKDSLLDFETLQKKFSSNWREDRRGQ